VVSKRSFLRLSPNNGFYEYEALGGVTDMERTSRTRDWAAAVLLLWIAGGSHAAVIRVEGTCELEDAIEAANLDEAVGGCSAGQGRDEIHLTQDVSLSDAEGSTPFVTSEIDVIGNGFMVERRKGASDLGLFQTADGRLGLYSVSLSRGTVGGRVNLVNSTISGEGSKLSLYKGRSVNSVISSSALVENSRVTDSVVSGGLTLGKAAHLSHSFVTGTSGVAGGVGFVTYSSIISNSTFSGNGTTRQTGIRQTDENFFGFGEGTTRLSNVTFAWNQIGSAGHMLEHTMPPYYGANVDLLNTIVAESGEGGDCRLWDADVDDRGGNFDSDASCGPSTRITELDVEARDHGGTTLTVALLPGSSAIGAGKFCEDSVDQRGIPRDPVACDAGAFEARELVLDLRSEGSCPGIVTVDVSGATPGSEVTVGRANAYRRTVLEGGRCAGTAVGIRSPAVFFSDFADLSGEISRKIEVSLEVCGNLLQAIDLETCEISGAATLVRPPPLPLCAQASICGLARFSAAVLEQDPPGVVDDYLVGDWDGNGCDSLAARDGNKIYFDTDFDPGSNLLQEYGGGANEDQYLVGDWNGDGCDDIAVRRGDQILMDTNLDGRHDLEAVFGVGLGAAEYFVGDLDGSGTDAVGYREGNQLHWDLLPWDGTEDGVVGFGGGESEDQYILGHWSEEISSQQTFAVRRGNEVLMNFELDGQHDFIQIFGVGDEDQYLVGDWDGDGRDNLAVRRGGVFEMDTNFDSEPDITMTFGEGVD